MSNLSTSKPASKSPQPRPTPNNFLEALRELGQDAASEAKIQVKQAVTQDVPAAFGFPSSGTMTPNEPFALPQMDRLDRFEKSRSQQSEMLANARAAQIRDEERAYLNRQEARMKEQIKSIQDELKLLAKSAGQLSQEVEKATFQAAVRPGLYHKNFFAHLKSILVMLRKQVNDSRHWLAEFNGRSRKQGHYWGQVNKSGTKYMLSSERYMVTSTG